MNVYTHEYDSYHFRGYLCLPTEAEDDGVDGLPNAVQHIVLQSRYAAHIISSQFTSTFQRMVY